MKISDWLDEKEAENVDVSQIVLPTDMSYDEVLEAHAHVPHYDYELRRAS